MIAEAPAAHRSPVTKSPRPSRPAKPKGPARPKTHEKHEAPTRKKVSEKKGKKETPKKSAGLDERDVVVEFDDGAVLRVPSLGMLPN